MAIGTRAKLDSDGKECPSDLAPRCPLTVVVLSLSTVLVALPARSATQWVVSDRSDHLRPWHLDATLNIGFFGTLHTGIGLWFSYPLLADGVIDSLNDELNLEVGGYLQYHSGYFSCANRWLRGTPLGGLRWTFFLTRKWSVFALVKMGASFPFAAENSCNAAQSAHIVLDGVGALGAYWQPTSWVGLRLELGSFGAAVGVTFMF